MSKNNPGIKLSLERDTLGRAKCSTYLERMICITVLTENRFGNSSSLNLNSSSVLTHITFKEACSHFWDDRWSTNNHTCYANQLINIWNNEMLTSTPPVQRVIAMTNILYIRNLLLPIIPRKKCLRNLDA